jgi:HAD superfamily hydrolase (TIGR01450 family)
VVIGEGFEICTSSPEFVLVGYDTELTYDKLVTVCGLINKGVDYIATHCDLICPSEQGAIPDIGTIINMLTTTTGKKPYKVFGKPEVELINDICKNKGLAKSDVLMIGDRLYTDIKMAVNASIDSLLVLSGDTSRDELENSNILPTYVLKDFSEIL